MNLRGCPKFSSQGGVTSIFLCQSMIFNLKCPCICCEVHVFEKYPNTLLLNTIIKYNMNKHSEPLFQKSNFSPPGSDKFFELLHYTAKNISIVLRIRGERNIHADVVSFVTILPIFATKRPDYAWTNYSACP